MSALRVQQFLLPLPKSVEPEGFHLTLVFLGEVQDWVLDAAHEAFLGVRVAPFDLSLQGLGLFGGAKPRAAWAGVAVSEPLLRLQAKLERAAGAAADTDSTAAAGAAAAGASLLVAAGVASEGVETTARGAVTASEAEPLLPAEGTSTAGASLLR